MAGKTEIILAVVEATLGKLLPATLDLIAQRKRFKRMVETGEEPTEAEWAEADMDLDAAVDALREQLLPEAEPEVATGAPVDDSG